MNEKFLKISAGLLSLLALGLVAWMAWTRLSPSPLPLLYPAPAFRLISQDAKPFDSASLKGKVWVASFVYSTCKGSCPMLGAQMKRLQDSLPKGEGFHLISISVDPEKDSPARMSQYARDLGADLSRWTFLTGKKQDIKRIAVEGFKLASEPGVAVGEDRDILHSSKLVLVDKQGRIRAFYDGLLSSSAAEIRGAAEGLGRES